MRHLQPRGLSVRPLALDAVSLGRTSERFQETSCRHPQTRASTPPVLLDAEDKGITILRNVGDYSLYNTTSYTRGLAKSDQYSPRSETLQLAFLHTPIFCYQECAFYLTSERMAHSFHAGHGSQPVPMIPDYLSTPTSYSLFTNRSIARPKRSVGNKPRVKGGGIGGLL